MREEEGRRGVAHCHGVFGQCRKYPREGGRKDGGGGEKGGERRRREGWPICIVFSNDHSLGGRGKGEEDKGRRGEEWKEGTCHCVFNQSRKYCVSWEGCIVHGPPVMVSKRELSHCKFCFVAAGVFQAPQLHHHARFHSTMTRRPLSPPQFSLRRHWPVLRRWASLYHLEERANTEIDNADVQAKYLEVC